GIIDVVKTEQDILILSNVLNEKNKEEIIRRRPEMEDTVK
ncbi:hypothetical protein LCGC14_2823280, partial [marine sediment metagenome]